MDEKTAPGYYGRIVGVISGVFSILQVLISAAALNGAAATVESYYVNKTDGILRIANMGTLILSTVLSAILLGCVTLVFAWFAGRLSAIAIGARKGGASAGLSVWWVSSLIWIIFSMGAAAIDPHNLIDALTSGAITLASSGAQYNANFFPLGFFTLLIIDVLGALVCLGLCAAAGALGASTAPIDRLSARAPNAMPTLAGYAAPMPPVGYYPNYPMPGAPSPYQAYSPTPGVYPPPPAYYAQQQQRPQQSPGAMPPAAQTPSAGATANGASASPTSSTSSTSSASSSSGSTEGD